MYSTTCSRKFSNFTRVSGIKTYFRKYKCVHMYSSWHGCYNRNQISAFLINFNQKYQDSPLADLRYKWTRVANPSRFNKKILKNVAKVWKITNFDRQTDKKRCRQGPGSGNLGQSNNFTATVLAPESYENCTVKIQLFMCLPPGPACFETGFGLVSRFEEGQPGNFSKTKQNFTKIQTETVL